MSGFKKCPDCGFQNEPSERAMLARYRKAFGTLPVMAMMKRGWLRCSFSDSGGWPSVEEVRAAVEVFFGDSFNEVILKAIKERDVVEDGV